jgi:hypothetical protein
MADSNGFVGLFFPCFSKGVHSQSVSIFMLIITEFRHRDAARPAEFPRGTWERRYEPYSVGSNQQGICLHTHIITDWHRYSADDRASAFYTPDSADYVH